MSLVESLAAEIDGCPNARDRLPLVRAFLAATTAVESLDASARREAREIARSAASGDRGGPSPLDSLIQSRGKLRGRV